MVYIIILWRETEAELRIESPACVKEREIEREGERELEEVALFLKYKKDNALYE